MVLATCRGRHELIQGACGCAYARLLGMQCTHLRVGKLVYATCNAAPGPWTGREWFITSLQTSRMALSSNLYMPMHHPVVCSGFRGHPLVSWPFPFVHGRLLVITCTHHQTVSIHSKSMSALRDKPGTWRYSVSFCPSDVSLTERAVQADHWLSRPAYPRCSDRQVLRAIMK